MKRGQNQTKIQQSTRENGKGGCWLNPMGWNGMRCVAEGRCDDGQLGRRTEDQRDGPVGASHSAANSI